MNTNFLKNISLLKLSGIRKIIVSDVHHNYIRLTYFENKANPLAIINKDNLKSFSVIANGFYNFTSGDSEIKDIFQEFLKQNKILEEEVYLIIGINDYRLNLLTIPSDTEDIDLWFLENSSRFLPEGRPADEFVYSYERIREIEDKTEFAVVVTRKDYVLKLIDSHNYKNLICISPTQLSLTCKGIADGKKILLDFLPDKTGYIQIDEQLKIISGEIYKSIFNNDYSEIETDQLESCINEISEIIKPVQSKTESAELSCYISIKDQYLKNVNDKISFWNSFIKINPDTGNTASNDIASILLLNKVFTKIDDIINFLPAEKNLTNRETIEKKAAMNSILACGGFIIAFLLILTIFEFIISSRIQDDQDSVVDFEAKSLMVSKLEKEQALLQANLSLLNRLKTNKINQPGFLKNLSEIVNENTCLTEVALQYKGNQTILELNGLAYGQQDINQLMSNMEQKNCFNDVRLIFSNSVKTEKLNIDKPVNESELFNFKITSGYYEIQK
ncbi:MAG: PilN domain-containing protein [Ignavibacteria bacterium]|nr:PilN domain-containing protein [Ignavibacteria bacterium]